LCEAWTYLFEQLASYRVTADYFQSLSTGVEITTLTQRYQLVSNSTQLFRLRLSGDNTFMLKEGCSQISQ
jgi:hypothetical protein